MLKMSRNCYIFQCELFPRAASLVGGRRVVAHAQWYACRLKDFFAVDYRTDEWTEVATSGSCLLMLAAFDVLASCFAHPISSPESRPLLSAVAPPRLVQSTGCVHAPWPAEFVAWHKMPDCGGTVRPASNRAATWFSMFRGWTSVQLHRLLSVSIKIWRKKRLKRGIVAHCVRLTGLHRESVLLCDHWSAA